MFEGDKASLKPYIAANRFTPITDGSELIPGIPAVPTRPDARQDTLHTPSKAVLDPRRLRKLQSEALGRLESSDQPQLVGLP
jgi:hypothetical protein